MRICVILEGCYPYVTGGVSTWIHQYMQAMPQHEFVVWAVGANARDRGKFKYKLPPNVAEVREIFLDEALKMQFVKDMFLPIGFELRIFWQYHFGIIGIDATMKLDEMALY